MAITVTAAVIATELDIDLTRATRLLSVASALVNDYCPEAPEPIANESVLMAAGWLWGNGASRGSIRSEGAGPLRITYATHEKNALKHSGAEAMLSPFKVRRAMVIA